MRIIECDINNYNESFDGILLLGNFDGVHLGHQELVKRALSLSDDIAVLLFRKNPLDVLLGGTHEVLTALDDKIRFFLDLGVDTFYIIDDDPYFFSTPKNDFIYFLKQINPRAIVVGEDYSFGCNKEGKALDLKKHFKTEIVPLLCLDKEKISTTSIARFIKEGNITKANEYLGRPYEIMGQVVKGLGNGQKISFPTANIKTFYPYLLPKDGVYLGIIYLKDKYYKALINVGKNPTIGLLEKSQVEVHVLGIKEDIYDEIVFVSFLSYLREEKKFESLEALKKQIELDKKSLINR